VTQEEIRQLVRDARRLREHAGISRKTVATAFSLHVSELSRWENQRMLPGMSPRTHRYLLFLAGLRRAEINQAAAQALLADNEPYDGRPVWECPPGREEAVGTGSGVGPGLLL
jgi:transcriptional regulator with XRE-family HTH domain